MANLTRKTRFGEVLAASIALCAVCVCADMASLVVPAGDEMTISASATYDTVTVNGTLIVNAGTLTATNAFRIADGAGATGTLVITNSGKILSSEGTLAVGVNGGSGTVRIHTTGNVCRFVEIGDGGGASTIRYAGGQIQSRNLRKKGSGTCRLEFAGGSHHFGMPNWFQLDDGQLTLASVDGAPIELRCAGNNPGWHYFAETSGSGTMATEGTGAVGINFRQWADVSQTFSLETGSRITWGHTGGFELKGLDRKLFKATSPDFFLVGGAPVKVGIYGGWLDLLGKHVPMKDLSGWGGITNTANEIGAVVLGGDGGDHALRGGWAWSPKAALCKIGAGTLTYNGDDFTGRVIVSNGVFRAAAVHDVAYSHYRFVIDDCMGTARNSMQLSEFRLLCGDLDVTSSRSGYTCGNGADDRFNNSQGPGKALDGSFKTKWLTMQTGASNAEALYKTNCWLQLDFDHPCAISDYDWATANDFNYGSQGSGCRDPMKWRLLGSNDGETWTLLDSRDIGKKDLERDAWTGPYSASDAKEASFGAIDLAGGVFEVEGRVASADIVQNGGDFRIAETGAVRLVDGEWRGPSFAAGSSGRVASDSSSANKMLCEDASFRCDLAVNSGALEFYKPLRTTHRLFRFTIKKTYSASDCTQLSRLRLFDADGNVLSDGLTAADPGTAPASLPAGQCAYAASYSQGGSSNVKNLFDGSTSTKMCLTSLSMGGAPENNTWRTVVFRLAADVTAPVVSYQLTTANDYTPARNPSVWTLESSADGENWTLLDGRRPGEFVNPTATYADFNNGVPMALRSAATIPVELVTLADGALLSVASGASLGPAETTFSTAGLRVDCADGAGTISRFAPRADGRLELVGVSNGTDLAGYLVPVTIQSFADTANLKTWTVFVNGAPKGGAARRRGRQRPPARPQGHDHLVQVKNMKRKAAVLISLCALCACGEPVDYVNPFVGTAAQGDTYPGPVWPLGMVQPGPDTGDRYWSSCQGYHFRHTTVMGFSQTHLSGTGCPDFQDVALLPFTGDVSAEIEAYKAWAAVECRKAFETRKGVPRRAVILGRMDKRTETAEPGYYAVTLTNWGVRAELTCSPRVAYHRYTFKRGGDAHIYVNLQSGPQGWWKNPPPDRMGEHRSAWDAEQGLLTGYSCITAWAVNRDLSFAVQFSPRPKAARRLEPLDGWKGDRWVLDFDLPDGGAVIAKAAVSSVDESGAKANLFADAGFDFDARRAACRAAWNRFLTFAEIEASEDKKTQFYTALYHAYVQPNMLSDVDGRYRDDARKVVKADGFTVYSTFSTWDTVRAAHPLYTILTPSLAADFVNSMIDQQRASGKLSKWPLWGRETGCMVALHSVPVVVDAVLKGMPGIDAGRAFAAVDASLADRGPVYDTCGYFPWNVHHRSVAVTLEWCLDDWCAAVLAEKLGKTDRAAFYRRRANYWKNLFDPWTGYMRGKDAKGNWHEPFNPYRQRPEPGQVHDYVEGSAIQYTFHVMQDPEGLIEAFGGQKPFYRALDAFFTLPSKMPGQSMTGECTGTIGQYAHGNEPSHHVAYFFPYVGRGDRTAEIVREICDKYYLNKPDGLVGNDDCGQMSAWFVFACLGFYSFNPCGGEYVIGAPQVPKTTLHLEGGRTFTVVAKDLSEKNKYVKSVALNGVPYRDFILRHADIMRGGELVFQMCGAPARE